MKTSQIKKYCFSASFSRGERVIGHNYILGVMTDALDEGQENALDLTVQRALIEKIDSRDLGKDVDFLKNIKIDEMSLLKAFWKILKPEIHPILLRSLFLEKDGRSQMILSED